MSFSQKSNVNGRTTPSEASIPLHISVPLKGDSNMRGEASFPFHDVGLFLHKDNRFHKYMV